jgi:hypothetical protein
MIWRLVRRVAAVVLAVVLLVGISAAIAVVWVESACAPEAVAAAQPATLPIDVDGYRRTEANTYFTFPEWYIVYAFEDFGAFLDEHPESAFPYLGQIVGFWQSFCAANRVAAALPGDHFEYKLTIYVIGLSFTYEYLIKGLYENTIGRLTEWLRGPTPSAADVYARLVAQDYAAFLHQVPWYEYPFMDALAGLWRGSPLIGASPIRDVERKLALSAEYLVKAGYARLIALGLAATSAPADLEIMFVADGDVGNVLAAEAEVRLVRQLSDGRSLLVAPRYRAFTNMLKRLAAADVGVVEIAGNRRILMSAIVPDGVVPEVEGSRALFVLPIAARPGFARIGFDVDVPRLMPVLREYAASGIEIEHLYDY